ncbi:MAG: serine hydrolase domain-containing protein [Bacteroidota bacterium]
MGLLQDKRFHSVSVAVYKNGNSVIRHFGELEEGKGNAPTDSSLYDLASVTKTFTGTLTAQATLAGKLSLEDDIRDYLHGSYPNLEFKGQKITIRHLLTHTSDFPNFPINGDSKDGFLKSLQQMEIKNRPGTAYRYSNTAPELMAYILEVVYETPYHQLVAEKIFEPYNMTQSRFALAGIPEEHIVVGYDGRELVPKFKRTLWGGAAGLHATAPDLVSFMQMQLDQGCQAAKESHQVLGKSPYDFDIGYYWNIVQNSRGLVQRHHGGTYGMQNWLMLFPEHDMGIVVLTNSSFEETGEILEDMVYELFDDLKDKKIL